MMTNNKWYAYWVGNDILMRCSTKCLSFDEAESLLNRKRSLGYKTTLENCRILPQIFYGHAASAIRASERFKNPYEELE